MTTGTARYKTLIVDDEPLARTRLRTLLANEPDVEIVGEAGSGSAAVAAIATLRPDLLFLDVQMPEFDGFEVLRATADIHQPLVVFVTAFDEHAIRAFDVQAIDYVLKPVIESRFRAAVQRAIVRLRDTPRPQLAMELTRLLAELAPADRAARISIRHDGRVTFVRVADIEWIGSDGDLLRIHAGRDLHTVRETMLEMEARLPAAQFARVHRSAIVNVDRIKEVQPWFKGDYVIVMQDGTKLRTGRTYRERVQQMLR